jgi:origin recognition complex subunit 1
MRELSLIFANPDPSKKAGCSKCRYVGCKACRGYTQKEKEMWERQQGTRSDRQGEAGTVVVVPDTGEKEQDPAHVAGEQQQVRGEITDGLVLMTEADFCVDLEGKEVMVYWGKTFKAWYRARVVRFDDRARKAFLYYPRDEYKESFDKKKFKSLIAGEKIKLIVGEVADEEEESQNNDEDHDLSEELSQELGLRYATNEEFGMGLVGKRLSVYWGQGFHGWFQAMVQRFDPKTRKMTLYYPEDRYRETMDHRKFSNLVDKARIKVVEAEDGVETGERTPLSKAREVSDNAPVICGGRERVPYKPILTPTRFTNPPPRNGCPKCRFTGCKACRGFTKAELRQWQEQEGIIPKSDGIGAAKETRAVSVADNARDEAAGNDENDENVGPASPLVPARRSLEPLLTPTRFTNPPPRNGCPKCRFTGCKACRGFTKAELRQWQEQEGIIPKSDKKPRSKNARKTAGDTVAAPKRVISPRQKSQKRNRSPSSANKASRRAVVADWADGAATNAQGRVNRSLRFLPIEDERFEVGDDVLIATDDRILQHDLEQEDESFVCHECHGHGEASNQLLECAKCMHTYHQHCLKSPLSSIPDGIWICDDCLSGERIDAARPLTSAREFFLQQKGLALGRIESITMQNEEYFVTCRWFCLPEETHVGRQSNHTAREVFLASHKNQVTADAIFRRAKVVSLSEFSSSGDVDEDMFICDYEYDYQWRRFYRISEWDQRNDYGFGSESDDDEARDATFKLTLDLMRQEADGHRRGKKKRRLQGGLFGAKLQPGTADVADDGFSSLSVVENDIIKASRALSLATIPDYMPCREEQQEQIEDFMRNAIASSSSSRNKAGKCLYISGIPGTGKTACVMDIVRNMTQSGNRNFHFIEINGLQLPSPMHVYSKLCEALTGETVGPSTAMMALEDLFTGKSQKEFMHGHHIIVLLDEMDSIVNKSQKALYNLFDWPSNPSSNLSIIGIANTMDLPERLHPRIASRLAANKVVFHPYQKDDLQTIVQARLEAFDTLFEDAALQYAARKVANCSGDLRRCLELCRRALEVALRRADGVTEGLQVRARDIDAAAKEAYNSPSIKMLAGCTRDQLMLMAAMCLECQYSGAENETIILEDVFHRLNGSFPGYSIALPGLLHSVSTLGSSKLILCDGVSNRLGCKISLNVVKEDLKYVLSDETRSDVERNAGGRLT